MTALNFWSDITISNHNRKDVSSPYLNPAPLLLANGHAPPPLMTCPMNLNDTTERDLPITHRKGIFLCKLASTYGL
ncbi:hypothetical protein CEXT_460931 [Caerostris extrusa]|uniref:Uncharacterized protein n=1 Tax=Caerostris extrusa TaxID=172846 RepID=A0AAV4MVU5_CAEEX|nr:hypothetical protein CEXT_460931 [Caerostris extrusa]